MPAVRAARAGTSHPDRLGRRFLDRNESDEDTMSKNILVFSDGTGQAGGLHPDENRSNIYKMFRATRCGPDTNINAGEQIAFYDAGLGSQPPHGAFLVTRAWRWLHNVASQATGLGIKQLSDPDLQTIRMLMQRLKDPERK
jgi:uncharacterized protein (DUF2235 family)